MNVAMSMDSTSTSAKGMITCGLADIDEEEQPVLRKSQRKSFTMKKLAEKREKRQNRRASSIDVRRKNETLLIPQIDLVTLEEIDDNDDDDDSDDNNSDDNYNSKMENGDNLIKEDTASAHKGISLFCLNPKYELRTQLLLSFGSVSFVSILLVVSICCLANVILGENFKTISKDTLNSLYRSSTKGKARYLAESLEHQLLPRDGIQILYEAIQDRFDGLYDQITDNQDNNNHNHEAPFKDLFTDKSIYPVIGPPLPFDWEIENDLTEENHQEHVQDRYHFYRGVVTSTKHAVAVMQGVCDPSQTDKNDGRYFTNCTDENNDISTGGVISPNEMTVHIHERAKDLVPLQKMLYEYNDNWQDTGFYFANQGSGYSVNFPAQRLGSTSYKSIGCDWMKMSNPYNSSKTIATQQEIDKCRPQGTVVPSRIYNPLEREWCQEQAMDPKRIHYGKVYENAWVKGNWQVMSGRAVYDRKTHDFIACIYVGVEVSFLDRFLEEFKNDDSHISVVYWSDEGSVVVSSALSSEVPRKETLIYELSVGISNNAFQDITSLIDYNSEWDPTEVNDIYEQYSLRSNGYSIKIHPIPPIPDKFDEMYKPFYLVIVSIADDTHHESSYINKNIDSSVTKSLLFSCIAGIVGLVLIMIILLLVSNAMTSPLHAMDITAQNILNNFGNHDNHNGNQNQNHSQNGSNNSIYKSNNENNEEKSVDAKIFNTTGKESNKHFYLHCTPKTEITDFVDAFNKMLVFFSGSLMGKDEHAARTQIRNKFTMRNEFTNLYNSRADSKLAYGSKPLEEAFEGEIHLEKHLHKQSKDKPNVVKGDDASAKTRKRRYSRLFVWILYSLVMPLLVLMVIISVVVISMILLDFRNIARVSQQKFLDETLLNLDISAKLRAQFSSSHIQRSMQQLYILSRYGDLLLFDGLKRRQTFQQIISLNEECKINKSPSDCAFALKYRVCGDCARKETKDEDKDDCRRYSSVPRNLQMPFFTVEKSSNALSNGTRLNTTYPFSAYSPKTTKWYENINSIPGSYKGGAASGYETTYDRLRVISANPLFAMLRNADASNKDSKGMGYSFEDDGLFYGDFGCNNWNYSLYTNWQSSVENRAAEIRPELCPIGKFGLDTRCLEWYDNGRRLALKDGNNPLHITSPYIIANNSKHSGGIEQKATASLVDPRSGYYVGQVVIDFLVDPIFTALDDSTNTLKEGGFPILLSTSADTLGGKAIIAPGINNLTVSKSLLESILPTYKCDKDKDPICYQNYIKVSKIEEDMKKGNSGNGTFTRSNKNGVTEKFYISYHPVTCKFLRSVDSSNFSRGVEPSKALVYSLALVEREDGVFKPFRANLDRMKRAIFTIVFILAIIIFLAIASAIYMSYSFAISVTEPILRLLKVIRSLEKKDFTEPLPVQGGESIGSKEMLDVQNTIDSLYKVIRFANSAFFQGDYEVAYNALTNLLAMFDRLENNKAIALASNNLGNTLTAIIVHMKEKNKISMATQKSKSTTEIYGLSRKEMMDQGIARFHDTIALGEKAYDEYYEKTGWSPSCLDFMQHLSNRYFNRAMFLSSIKDYHEHPDEIERLAFRDLDITKDMDFEIIEYGEDVQGVKVNRAHSIFIVGLARLRGYIMLLEMGWPVEEHFDIEEKFDYLFKILNKEKEKVDKGGRNSSSKLFESMSYIGRRQELELELIKYKQAKGDVEAAAKVAIRALFEDKYIFAEAIEEALRTLLTYLDLPAQAISRKDSNSSSSTAMSRLNQKILLQQILYDIEKSIDKKTHASSHSSSFRQSGGSRTIRKSAYNCRQSLIMEQL